MIFRNSLIRQEKPRGFDDTKVSCSPDMSPAAVDHVAMSPVAAGHVAMSPVAAGHVTMSPAAVAHVTMLSVQEEAGCSHEVARAGEKTTNSLFFSGMEIDARVQHVDRDTEGYSDNEVLGFEKAKHSELGKTMSLGKQSQNRLFLKS
jgi:hypothetical protein